MALVLLGSFFLLLLCNVPVAASMGLASILGMLYGGFSISGLATLFASSVAKFTLLAIPFFVLAGVIMDYSGISKRLVNFIDACLGHRKGGLAIVTVVVACFFAAISGSGPATVAALGGVLIPAMVDKGYNKNYSSALLAASGGIGMIIPPSIPFVIYGMLAQVSVGGMFMAGIIPGILMGVIYSIAALWGIRKDTTIVQRERATGEERWQAFKDAIGGLLMPVIILGGIYGGIFTPTEAAGVAVVYGLIVGIFIYKEIDMKALWHLMVDASVTSAVVMFIMGAAGVFTWILTTSGLAMDLSDALLNISSNKYVLLLMFNIIFLIAGCFVDSASGMYILMPIMLPIVHALDINLFAFGVMVTVNFAVGQITPPVGSNLFVACNIAKISMSDIVSRLIPFIVAGIVGVLLITYLPILSTLLPGLMGYC